MATQLQGAGGQLRARAGKVVEALDTLGPAPRPHGHAAAGLRPCTARTRCSSIEEPLRSAPVGAPSSSRSAKPPVAAADPGRRAAAPQSCYISRPPRRRCAAPRAARVEPPGRCRAAGQARRVAAAGGAQGRVGGEEAAEVAARRRWRGSRGEGVDAGATRVYGAAV